MQELPPVPLVPNEVDEPMGIADQFLDRLLACQWGHAISTPDMPERCDQRAVKVHQLYGTPLGTIQVRLCQVHSDRCDLETEPHAD